MFFIVFEWDRIFESAMDKWEMKYNVELHLNYFSANVFVLACCISPTYFKKPKISGKIVGF